MNIIIMLLISNLMAQTPQTQYNDCINAAQSSLPGAANDSEKEYQNQVLNTKIENCNQQFPSRVNSQNNINNGTSTMSGMYNNPRNTINNENSINRPNIRNQNTNSMQNCPTPMTGSTIPSNCVPNNQQGVR